MATDDAIGKALKSHLNAPAWQWLSSQVGGLADNPTPGVIARVFTSLPRQLKSGDTPTAISLGEPYEGPGGLSLVVTEWSVVKLARVWLLTRIPKLDEAAYVRLIEQLFKYGEMEELVALYAALPVYHYPEAWRERCKEGIRSNIGSVRHTVIVNNPYPARFLDEESWNQMVLKAFFTDEDIAGITGLRQRNNLRLAQSLTDYAYERHAAQREINPMLWILVGPFIGERAFDLMSQLAIESRQPLERQAIAYAFAHSDYDPAQRYLKEHEVPASFSESRGTPWEAWEQ